MALFNEQYYREQDTIEPNTTTSNLPTSNEKFHTFNCMSNRLTDVMVKNYHRAVEWYIMGKLLTLMS